MIDDPTPTSEQESIIPSLIKSGTPTLVQCDDWFFAPDGQQYRVAWGPLTILRAKDLLGFEPKNSANWYAQLGSGPSIILIAGCRIHYVQPCTTKPISSHVFAFE